MSSPLWTPSEERIGKSRLSSFMRELAEDTGHSFDSYAQLYQWSVAEPEQFWERVWRFTGIRASTPYVSVLEDADRWPGAKWFPGARLNFAENLLRRRDDHTAIISRLEDGSRKSLTYSELYAKVEQLAAGLRNAGVQQGDRVAGFMPNVAETIIAMLATASIGAIWTSCSPDFGVDGVIDRFGQIMPKVLFACDGYFYNGKTIDCRPRVREIVSQIDSLLAVVTVPVIHADHDQTAPPKSYRFDDFMVSENTPPLRFEQLPFDHPLFLLYSSGTTGKPKCIVHSAGGTLIQHLKEHQLHVDLQPDDTFFYFTTCGWMMWNWLASGLASGATLVLYDGSPFYPQATILLDMIDEEQISIFGTSAKYISAIAKEGLIPRDSHILGSLNTVLSTGSPLSDESFKYVYRDVKGDVCLSSISGGTDIVSCFALGNTCLPVWEGELQCLGLGMEVQFWDLSGAPVVHEKGELVCVSPFPCAPVGFWNDPGEVKYKGAYFDRYPGTWAHGDFGELTEHDGVIIHGRSDAVLNPGGVRIGTAEIYRQVEKIAEVSDSICIGQDWGDDIRVVLFVVLQSGVKLTDELQQKIRTTIRSETSPRHVPAKIIEVSDIPRTNSGKIVELAVRDVVHGRPVANTAALSNPEALELFSNLPELKR